VLNACIILKRANYVSSTLKTPKFAVH